METPFVFGKLAINENFTNRSKETNHLIQNFSSGINTILISPRRWGKSSLVSSAAKITKEKFPEIKIGMVDMYNVRTEEQFYEQLVDEVIKITSNKIENVLDITRSFLGKLVPKINMSTTNEANISLSFDWDEVKKNPDEILNLANNIAKKRNIKIVVSIDEFQNISYFDNPLAFQKKLRSHWQKHQNCSYCLYGSKRHMLMDVFTNSSMPFYKFGDLLFLEKIELDEWISFIVKRFEATSKKIIEADAKEIAKLANCHSYYVQQLAQQVWLRTKRKCKSEMIQEAFNSLINQLSLLFQSKTDELATSQINYLKALINGEKHISSKSTIKEYQLGTSANVLKIKKALINKEILDDLGGSLSFLDPMYKHWLRINYFKI